MSDFTSILTGRDGQSSGPVIEWLNLAAVLRDGPPPVDWALEGFAEFGEVLTLSGQGKAGKSAVALGIGMAGLRGELFVGTRVAAFDWVAYIDAENPAKTVLRRLHLLGLSDDIAGRLHYARARGIDVLAPGHLDAIAERIPAEGRGLIVLDSAVALHRSDENAAAEVRQVVDAIRTLGDGRNALTLLLAHENRAGNLRGSLDWRNATDGTLKLSRDDAGVRTLEVVERRDGVADPVITFRFETVADERTKSAGQLVLEMTVAEAGPKRANRVPTKVDVLTEHVRELLRAEPGISRKDAAKRLTQNPDGGTFKRAWAAGQLDGPNRANALTRATGPTGHTPYKGVVRPGPRDPHGDPELFRRDGETAPNGPAGGPPPRAGYGSGEEPS